MTLKTTSRVAALAAAAAVALLSASATAQAPKLKVGLMLPYTGTFAALGMAIENGFRLNVAEQGGKLAGREIEFVKVDDESDPAKATDNVNKLIKRDNVDVHRRHRALGRRDGDGQGRQGQRHAADRAQRRRRRGHRPDVRATTSSAARSPTGSRAMRWARWWPRRATRRWSPSPGSTPPATSRSKGFKEAFEKGGGQVVEGAEPAVPQRRVPGAADRDRGDQARRRVHLLRRRRRGEVRQGLRGSGPEEDDPAVRRGLPHRRHARGAGRRRRRPADHAALRRRLDTPTRQGVPRSPTSRPTSCSPTSTPCRATTRRRCWRSA